MLFMSLRDESEATVPLPLYYRIKEQLFSQIKSGVLKPGDQIPTEEQLCEMFQVSRMTVRRAVNELSREGHLIRRQGVGTFVAEPVIERKLYRLTTLAEELQTLGYSGLHSRLLGMYSFRASPQLAKMFAVQTGDSMLLLRRVRYTKDVPIAVQHIIFPGYLCEGFKPSDAEHGSLYQFFEQRLQQPIEWGKQRIEAVAATKFHANLLEVPFSSPLLKVTKQAFLADGKTFEFTKTFYRPDRYYYQVDLYR
jgi:GntR family transcriptional regulator